MCAVCVSAPRIPAFHHHRSCSSARSVRRTRAVPALVFAWRIMGWLSGVAWCSAGVGAITVMFGGLLFVFQDKLLYIPSVPIRDPDDNPPGELAKGAVVQHSKQQRYKEYGFARC